MFNVIILPIIAGLIAQAAKFIITANKLKFKAKNLISYSGMPSAHTAAVVALAAIIGLEEGVASPIFGLSFIFAIIIIRDALGLRKYLGQHGKILNKLVRDLKDDEMLDEKYPKLLEKIGHTPLQAMMGGAIGLAVAVLGFYLF